MDMLRSCWRLAVADHEPACDTTTDAGRHIENVPARAKPGTAERLRPQAEVRGSDELVIARRDPVPG
ncbi:MAG: hypothetical protein ACREV2_15355, partial [Burkholderiales bacterium]